MKIMHATAFYKEEHGGNKAGVVFFSDALLEKEMQEIAARIGYSETAFVSHSDEADFEVRFFTPTKEVNLCGHATIATFNMLRDQGVIQTGVYTQKTKAGRLRLKVEEESVYMEQLKPSYYQKLSAQEIQSMFSNDLDLHPSLPVEVVSTGLKEIFLPLRSEEALNQLRPKFDAMIDYCLNIGAIGVHAFCIGQGEMDGRSRNFAPVVGIKEESATGTSNGALACYMHKYVKKKATYHMEQGIYMDQPSEIFVRLTLDEDYIEEVWVGGKAKLLKIED